MRWKPSANRPVGTAFAKIDPAVTYRPETTLLVRAAPAHPRPMAPATPGQRPLKRPAQSKVSLQLELELE